MTALESNVQSTKTVTEDPLPRAFAEVVKEAVMQSNVMKIMMELK